MENCSGGRHSSPYLIEVGLLTIDNGAIRQCDAHRRNLHTGSWGVSKRGDHLLSLGCVTRRNGFLSDDGVLEGAVPGAAFWAAQPRDLNR